MVGVWFNNSEIGCGASEVLTANELCHSKPSSRDTQLSHLCLFPS